MKPLVLRLSRLEPQKLARLEPQRLARLEPLDGWSRPFPNKKNVGVKNNAFLLCLLLTLLAHCPKHVTLKVWLCLFYLTGKE